MGSADCEAGGVSHLPVCSNGNAFLRVRPPPVAGQPGSSHLSYVLQPIKISHSSKPLWPTATLLFLMGPSPFWMVSRLALPRYALGCWRQNLPMENGSAIQAKDDNLRNKSISLTSCFKCVWGRGWEPWHSGMGSCAPLLMEGAGSFNIWWGCCGVVYLSMLRSSCSCRQRHCRLSALSRGQEGNSWQIWQLFLNV